MKRNIPALWGADSQVPFLRVILLLVELCVTVLYSHFSYFSLVLLFPLSIWLYRQREEHFIKGLYSKANSP